MIFIMEITFLPLTAIGTNGYCRHSMPPSVRPFVRPERCYNSLTISTIGLKFGGMINSTKKQIIMLNGHARQIF